MTKNESVVGCAYDLEGEENIYTRAVSNFLTVHGLRILAKEGIDLFNDLDLHTNSDRSCCTMTIIKEEDFKNWGQEPISILECLLCADALPNSIDTEYECSIKLTGLNEKDNQKV